MSHSELAPLPQGKEFEPIAVVAAARTPFARAFGPLAKVSAVELGRIAVQGALQKAGLAPEQIEETVFGNVAGPADASNVSRVIALKAGIPHTRIAHTVNRNCASGMEAVISGGLAIHEGRAEVVLAGGTESMSGVPLLFDDSMKDWMLALSKAKSSWQKLALMAKFRPSFLKPIPALQVGLTDPTCGLSMGQTAEILAREFEISREEQDAFALSSHLKALAAWERCFYSGEVVPVPSESGAVTLEKDAGPRSGQSMEALAKLKPVFEKNGTVTVGNSCPITDGAAALILMPAARAAAEGRSVLGYIKGYAIAGCDPRRMGLGPVFAISQLLEKARLSLSDFDLFEINEAFSAQVLACVKALRSPTFAREQLGRSTAVGEIDMLRLNVNGGAIALGHPVGTTGARLIMTLLRALNEKKLRRGLASLCVGGGQGVAVWLETPDMPT